MNKTLLAAKFLCFCSLLLSATCVQAQVHQKPELKLPSALPPSPNASDLGRVGNIPVSLSTGSMNYSIPLINLKCGELSLGMSLDYGSGGVKVDQIASRAGVGWTLNAGGVINRTAYGEKDESSYWTTSPGNINTNTPEAVQFLDRVTTSKDSYDTQPDIFSFNFNGYSGKFILNPESKSEAIFITRSNLKVATNFNHLQGDTWTLKVTDTKGVEYFFGGSGATEKSRNTNSGADCGKTYDTDVENGWYLNRILAPSGDFITLNYLPVQFSYDASISETITEQTLQTRGSFMYNPVTGEYTYPPPGYSTLCTSSIYSTGVYLDNIETSKGAKVVLGYVGRQDIAGDKLVSQVQYGPTNGPILKTFNLTYNQVRSNFTGTGGSADEINRYRPFLIEVREFSQAMSISKKHLFSYYNAEELSPRLSFAQDHWGFFNGRNNPGLIPEPKEAGIFSYAPADRNPNPATARFGMLRKITYPTGGTDSLVYEANTANEFVEAHPEDVKTTDNLHVIGIGNRGSNSVSKSITSYKDGMNIYFSASYSGSGTWDQIHQRSTVRIVRQDNQQVLYDQYLDLGDEFSGGIEVPAGSYLVTLTSEGQAAFGTVDFTYVSGIVQIPDQNITKIIGGVRVASVVTKDGINPTARIKKYTYNHFDFPLLSSGILLRPDINYFSTYSKKIQSPAAADYLHCDYYMASSNTFRSLYIQDGNHILYTDVVESDGTALENGGVLHQFTINAELGSAVARGRTYPGMSYSILGKIPFFERYQLAFRSNGESVIKLKETFTSYKSIPFENIQAFAGRKNYTLNDFESVDPGEPYDVSTYFIKSFWNYIDSTKTVDYDLNGQNPVNTLTVNFYDNPNHLQVTRSRTDKSDGNVQTRQLIYPQEMVNQGRDADGTYAAMILKNRVADVVEEKALLNDAVLLDLKRTNYHQYSSGMFMPQTVELYNTLSGNTEPRITYHRYDGYGNVLSLSMADGPKVNYLWSYFGEYPVAKISNIDYGTLESIIGSLSIASLSLQSSIDQSYLDNLLAGVKAAHPEAQIETYLYEPMVGQVRATDQRGKVTYYEYDDFQRLKVIKDNNQDIVKAYEYNYKGN